MLHPDIPARVQLNESVANVKPPHGAPTSQHSDTHAARDGTMAVATGGPVKTRAPRPRENTLRHDDGIRIPAEPGSDGRVTGRADQPEEFFRAHMPAQGTHTVGDVC